VPIRYNDFVAKPKKLDVYCDKARERGAADAVVISPSKVFTAAWVRLRCQFGCSEYGQCLTCPPHSPTPETTRRVLDEYRAAILLHGLDWASIREIGRSLEQEIFLDGYYKAFSLLCGPCWECKNCALGLMKHGKPVACRHPELARPSMEAAGIDVFATARAAGLPIEVVRSEGCQQNYYALVLVE
jgi:predicted metal-binding protein